MASDDHAVLRVLFMSFRETVNIIPLYCRVLVPETLVNKASITTTPLNMGNIKIVYPIFKAVCAPES